MADITGFDWEHVKTGGRYRIVALALREDTLQQLVVYKSVMDGNVWVRPVAEFFDGRFVDTRVVCLIPQTSTQEHKPKS